MIVLLLKVLTPLTAWSIAMFFLLGGIHLIESYYPVKWLLAGLYGVSIIWSLMGIGALWFAIGIGMHEVNKRGN